MTLLLRIDILDQHSSKETIKTDNIIRFAVETTLEKLLKGKGVPLILRPTEIAVVMGFAEESEVINLHQVESFVKECMEMLKRDFGLLVVIGIGNFASQLFDLDRSFKQAEQALLACIDSGKDILWYSDMPRRDIYFIYSVQDETKLISFTVSGNIYEVTRLLENLNDLNFHSDAVTADNTRAFLTQLTGTAYRLAQEHVHLADGAEQLHQSYEDDGDLHQWFNRLKSVFLTMCTFSKQQRRSRNDRLLLQIQEYLEQQYSNPDLTVVDVASKFNLSASYFPQFFKEHLGISFSLWLERLRIDNACKILSESNNKTIEGIAEEVGYRSVRTFRRAFKRNQGVSPKEHVSSS
ncbi:helix-turn-helix domain-containing protein [bacterium]|nr:helix-turn-helix domain-containing protein [bacterium]